MSGLCGIVSLDGSAVTAAHVATMASAAPHRGAVADSWNGEGGVVVTQRHADTDTATALLVTDGLVVAADARIDNRDEIAASLGMASQRFEPARNGGTVADRLSDVTVIAAAYRRWGAAFVERLIGDFAIVVLELTMGSLTLARDPMGMRALYHHLEPRRRIIIATEAKQILALPSISRRVNEPAVAAFLQARSDLPGDETYWHAVSQIAPGHVLVCDAAGSARRRFWDIDPDHRVFHRDRRAAATHLRDILTEAVSARVRSSTSAAVLLSGGMDSGSVAAVAGDLRSRSGAALSAYCWAYQRLTECDERHISAPTVRRYGIRQVDVPADDAGPLAGYPCYDVDADDPVVGGFQPLIEHSLVRARDDGVDLLLGGDRGDLALGSVEFGYLSLMLARRWSDLANEIAEHRQVFAQPLHQIVTAHLLAPLRYRLHQRNPLEWATWAWRRSAGQRPEAQPPTSWVRPCFARRAHELRDHAPEGLTAIRARRYRYIFMPVHMRGVLWSERTYARYGIQFADPFSDRRLVEFVMALPQSLIGLPNDLSKPLLRQAMRGVMPEPARTAARKILPTPLYSDGLRRAGTVIETLLRNSHAESRGWIDSAALLKHYDSWIAGEPLHAGFWHALSVERWLRVADPR